METWFPGGTSLGATDCAVLAVTTLILFFVGWYFGRGETTTSDFFLGGRRVPWWAACLSFVATEISAMTIIGVPATTFRENWQYAQFFIGSAASRLVIAYLFIPAFYQYECTTIYEFLRHRFGPLTQYTATSFFFVTRLLASGVRLMAACVAVSVLVGWHIIPVIFLFTLVSIVYIAFGGIKAVVWTNVVQALTFIVAGVATLVYLGSQIDGGIMTAWAIADEAGRMSLWHWGPAWGTPDYLRQFFKDPNIIWIAILNGFVGSMAAFGTDHELMQRLLTVDTRKASQRTMVFTIAGSFIVLLIFMMVGTGIYAFYQQHPEMGLPQALDKIYPHFAAQVMPPLLRGLVLSAIVMASIDSPLASLTAAFVTDIYKPIFKPKASETHYLFVSRAAVITFGLILAWIAWAFSHADKMLWMAFKIGGVTFGSLLGVFLLGLLTKRHANRANVFAMATMAVFNLVLLLSSEGKLASFGLTFNIGWSWLVIIGTAGTFGLGWLLGPVLDGPTQPSPAVPA